MGTAAEPNKHFQKISDEYFKQCLRRSLNDNFMFKLRHSILMGELSKTKRREAIKGYEV